MNNMYYKINPENFSIEIYDGINPEPFQYQPDYPNGDSFDSYEEAEEWAKKSIAAHNPLVEYYAPVGKNIPAEKKLTTEEKTIRALQMAGIDKDELKKILGL